MRHSFAILVLLIGTVEVSAQCAPTPHLCGNSCDVRTIIHGRGECAYDSEACVGTCAEPPNYTFSRLRTDYRSVFCAGAVPSTNAGLHSGASIKVWPLSRGVACLKIPPTQVAHRIYCVGAQDSGYHPRNGSCSINPGKGDACAISWSWANWGKGNKLTDGSHVFCVEFFNESGDRTRYFQLFAD